MKKLFTLFLMVLCGFATQVNAQDRYLDEVFTDVEVTSDINYATNITVLTVSDPDIGAPTLQNLTMDLYQPVGDTEEKRPVVLIFHTGNFLPQGTNGGPSGLKTDDPVVEVATRLAKRGYVAAAVDYRLGWNPIDPDINGRISTLINAAYRGIQDAHSCVRFLRKDAATDNNYRIDSDRVTLWGIGTGGYVTLGAASVDTYNELVLEKYIDSETGVPFVLEALSGDPFGEVAAPLNNPNHVGYESKAQLCVNMGGAIGDTSWISDNDPAFLNYQCPRDPFAPYTEDILIVPTTGDLIVEVQGAYLVSQNANAKGINSVFDSYDFDVINGSPQQMAATPFSQAASRLNEGFQGLFPLERPCPVSILTGDGEFCEASPWDWWNSAFWSTVPHPSCPEGIPLELCNFDIISRLNNNDASPEKGKIYIDSIMGHFGPRACVALDLPCAEFFDIINNTNDVIEAELDITPNPATDRVRFATAVDMPIESISIFSINGALIKVVRNIDTHVFEMTRDNIPTGMYVAKVQFERGIVTKKIMFE